MIDLMKENMTVPRIKKSYKIFMIAPQPFFSPRGTPFSVLHRIKALSLLGHKIDLVTYHVGEDVDINNLTIHRIPRVPFIKSVKIGPSTNKLILDVFLYLFAKKLLSRQAYDLIHTHEEAGFWGAGFKRRFKIPHLYDMHSSLPQQLANFSFTKSDVLVDMFEKCEKSTIENADAVITICPELQNHVENQYAAKHSIMIENVADNSLVFKSTDTELENFRTKYNPDGKKVVLYYGTFEPYQGIDLLINSAEILKQKGYVNIHFLLVGGNDKQVSHYRQIVEKKELGNSFTFTGFMAPQFIPGITQLADVLVSPRMRGNNSPLKIYSYLRSGIPIVATNHLTHTQILNSEVAFLTDIDSNSFATGITSAIEHNQLRNKIVKNAKMLVNQKYSYKSYLQKTQWVIEKAIKGS